MVKSLELFCFENCNKYLIAEWNFFSGSQIWFNFVFSENIQSQTEKSQNSLSELSYDGFDKVIFAQRYFGCGHWVCCQQTSSWFKAHTHKKNSWQRFLFSESWCQDIPHCCCQEALIKSANQVWTGEQLGMVTPFGDLWQSRQVSSASQSVSEDCYWCSAG